jgi:hypothetical protein
MKKKISFKLRLNRETLRNLEDGLYLVNGGGTVITTQNFCVSSADSGSPCQKPCICR